MIAYNYSKLRSREHKIYSVAGTHVSNTGISTSFLKIVGPVVILFLIIGFIICAIVGKNYFSPLGGNFSFPFVFIDLGLGIGIGCALWFIKIEQFRLYEYLIAYFKPKSCYTTVNDRNKEFKFNNYKVDATIYSDL